MLAVTTPAMAVTDCAPAYRNERGECLDIDEINKTLRENAERIENVRRRQATDEIPPIITNIEIGYKCGFLLKPSSSPSSRW